MKRYTVHARAIAVLTAAFLVGGLAGPDTASAAKDDTILVSRGSGDPGVVSNSSTTGHDMSADGRYFALVSIADEFSTEDNPNFPSAFVRDVDGRTTTLVSRATGAAGTPAELGAGGAAISDDGGHVAFSSYSDVLSTEDDDLRGDIFVRDVAAETTTLVSRADGPGGAGGDRDSDDPIVSADGRYVAFTSNALNLSGVDNDATQDVFLRDLTLGTTTLVSRASGELGAGGDANSSTASISADGSLVAFASGANNLSLEDNDTVTNVFVRDVINNTTELVSRVTGDSGTGGDGNSSAPAISADGKVVAFHSGAENLSDVDTAFFDVFVRDLETGTTELISRADGLAGVASDANSGNADISADGRHVAFSSGGTNLSDDDNFATTDIFVRDRLLGTTTFASRNSGPDGTAPSNGSSNAHVSSTGRYVGFTSHGTTGSGDGSDSDAFRRDVLGEPAVFHTLSASKAGIGDGTVVSTPAGIDCGSDCSEEFLQGTEVSLAATAGAGSSFTGWSGNCSGSAGCSLTMDAAKNVTATFEPVDVTAPSTRIDSAPSKRTSRRRAVFTFTSNDPTATFACRLDGAAFGPCPSPKRYSGLKIGTHTFRVRAIDASGNIDATPAVFTWRIR